MKRILGYLVSGLLLGSPMGFAQDSPRQERPSPVVSEPALDASRIDSTKWCVYASMIYSPGSVIFVRDRAYVCALVGETGPAAANLSWILTD